jgi:calcineurin-like phosphoesterase family protein
MSYLNEHNYPIVKPFVEINHHNVFFISDFHMGHDNVIKFDKRPFKDVNEMHQTIIDNWNSVVDDDSIVYYLGDLFYKVKANHIAHMMHKLKGEIRVILGNHDRLSQLLKMNRFSDIQTYQRISIIDESTKHGKTEIIASHYPHLIWDKHHHGSWHIHGHSHQNLTKSLYGKEVYYKRKVIDVGCNGWNYTPLSYSEIRDIMDKKNIEGVDHHG